MAKASKAINNLVDPALKKQFVEMVAHFEQLDSRAKAAAGKRQQYAKEIKAAGFTMPMVKTALVLATPEGEAMFKTDMANLMLAAAYADADIGDQLSLFLDPSRTPIEDRAFKEGQSASMKNEAAVPKYDPSTAAYRAFMEGYHEEQGRQVKAGIGKLEGKKAKPGKTATKSASAASKGKKRGRPAKAKGPNADPPAGSERTLIPKAEKDAKAAARAPKVDAAPPRKPVAALVTRGSMKAEREKAIAEADSFFTKSPAAGNA